MSICNHHAPRLSTTMRPLSTMRPWAHTRTQHHHVPTQQPLCAHAATMQHRHVPTQQPLCAHAATMQHHHVPTQPCSTVQDDMTARLKLGQCTTASVASSSSLSLPLFVLRLIISSRLQHRASVTTRARGAHTHTDPAALGLRNLSATPGHSSARGPTICCRQSLISAI